MRSSYVVAIAFVALVGAIVAAIFVWEHQRRTREMELTSYYGVKLGAPKSEVGYTLGYPSSVQGPYRPDPANPDWQLSDEIKVTKGGDPEGTPANPPGGSALTKYDEWHFDLPPDRVTVEFDPVKKTAMSIYCSSRKDGPSSNCNPIMGVTVGASETDVLKALGKPTHHEITGIYKSMKYQPLGLQLMLTKGRVYLIRKSLPTGA